MKWFSIKNLKRCFPYISTVLRVSYFKKVSSYYFFYRFQMYIVHGGSRYLKTGGKVEGGWGGVVEFCGLRIF